MAGSVLGFIEKRNSKIYCSCPGEGHTFFITGWGLEVRETVSYTKPPILGGKEVMLMDQAIILVLALIILIKVSR